MFDFLSQKFSGVLGWLKDRGRLTEENIDQAINQVKNALIEADVPLNVVNDFLDEIKADIIGKKVRKAINPGQQMIKVVHDKVLDFLGGKSAFTQISFQIPSVTMVMGLQGSGKTTTIAKVAKMVLKHAKKRGKQRKILLASVDFYRPAAVEQLFILSKEVGVDFYKAKSTDPIEASGEIYLYFKKNGYELLFLDTAGRIHIDKQMMEELKIMDKKLSPKHKLLVLDAMTGQESLSVAQSFNESVGFDSAILSKMDSDTRGGAAFAFRYVIKKPINFVGSGEKTDDLESFFPERMTSRILGMGDIMTLIEKADENINKNKQEQMTKKLLSGQFSLKDFLDQMGVIDKLGSLQKIARYLPGMGSISHETLEKGQVEIKQFKAIISSMNKKEQLIPSIIDGSRKKRIANGSGVSIQDVNKLLSRFDQSKKFIKMFGKNNSFKKKIR
jgi:signal recognition particle subunit SRP54